MTDVAPTARDQLAAAYTEMTAAEIAEHALDMADYIIGLHAKAEVLEDPRAAEINPSGGL